MAEIITTPDLGVYLEDDSLVSNQRAIDIVDRVNRLIEDKWADPVDPVPAEIEELALTVAARAWNNKPGRGFLQSETRAFDDSSKTQRFSGPPMDPDGRTVFLTDSELALLRGAPTSRIGSIRLAVPRTWR